MCIYGASYYGLRDGAHGMSRSGYCLDPARCRAQGYTKGHIHVSEDEHQRESIIVQAPPFR